MEPNLTRIVIADDHPIVRQGLELLINTQPDLTLIGQAKNGAQALEMIEEKRPDLVVIDLKMPEKDGLAVIDGVKSIGLDTKILVLTSFPDDEMVISAIQAGANGVLLKDSPPERLLEAIRAVSRGESILHPQVVQKLVERMQRPPPAAPVEHLLTGREIEVLQCLAQGHSNRQIARELSISTRTVTTHVRNILDKLGLDNRTQAALFAVEHGLIKPTTD